ncbi:MAG: exopolyphosphatase [Paenibacillaceae bacterium ZCTH02-B3]|nr:MAG: exopolyphosphatase [Paenibacillaceae bacterium ZCTH02-B3]
MNPNPGAGLRLSPPETNPEWEGRLRDAVAFLRRHDDFLIVSHQQPDGDAISSTVAAGWLLERLGKSFCMYNEGPVPSRMRHLWRCDRIVVADGLPAGRKFRRVVCVDCADFARIGRAAAWIADDAEILNIDHHATNEGFGALNLVRAEAAATAEIMFELLQTADVEWDKDIANAIYTGLLTDTGGFRYANTTPYVMSIASFLLERGADGPGLAEALLERISLEQLHMLQRALPRLSLTPDRKIAWLWVTEQDLRETGAGNEHLEGLVTYPRNLEGVEVGILFKQMGEGAVKVSLRSAGTVDVARVARAFGGGGHVRAAGCRLEAPLSEAIDRLVAEVQSALEES